MTQLTFGYSDSEDRIWLSVSSGMRFWLTRRLVSGFLPKVAELLEKTVPGGDIPNALPPDQRVALEHAEALEEDLDGKPAMEVNKETRTNGDPIPSAPPQLLTTLSVSADGTHCTLILLPDNQSGRVTLKRIEFHRLVAALLRTAKNSRWDITGLPAWMSNPPKLNS